MSQPVNPDPISDTTTPSDNRPGNGNGSAPTLLVVALAAVIAVATIGLLAIRSSGDSPVPPANEEATGGGGVHQHGTTTSPVGEWELGPDGLWQRALGDPGHTFEVTAFAPATEPSFSEKAAAAEFEAAARQAMARFTSPDVAKAEGYEFNDDLDRYHLVNVEFANDDDYLNPERPEFVMFDPPTGEFLGVMFLAPPGTNGPQFGGPLTVWHYHPATGANLRCWSGPLPIPGDWDPDTGQCRTGEERDRSPQMLHVWAIDHSDGPFATEMPS